MNSSNEVEDSKNFGEENVVKYDKESSIHEEESEITNSLLIITPSIFQTTDVIEMDMMKKTETKNLCNEPTLLDSSFLKYVKESSIMLNLSNFEVEKEGLNVKSTKKSSESVLKSREEISEELPPSSAYVSAEVYRIY